MNLADIDALFRRMRRLTDATRIKEGTGFEYQATLGDGSVHTYRIERLRSLETLEDDIANLCLWIWNAKDYLRKRARTLGKDPNSVEAAVNASPDLSLCADLANTLKHADLDRAPRSGYRPRLGKARFTMPHGSVRSIIVEAFNVTVEPSDLAAIQVTVPVENEQGQSVDDALELFARGVDRWEGVKADIEGTAYHGDAVDAASPRR